MTVTVQNSSWVLCAKHLQSVFHALSHLFFIKEWAYEETETKNGQQVVQCPCA